MNIRIGIVQSMKEIEVDMPANESADELKARISAVLGSDEVLWLTDAKGRTLGVPAARIAYIELATPTERVVGFGA